MKLLKVLLLMYNYNLILILKCTLENWFVKIHFKIGSLPYKRELIDLNKNKLIVK